MSEAAVKSAELFEVRAEEKAPETATIHYLKGAQPPTTIKTPSVPPETGFSRHTHADNHPPKQHQRPQHQAPQWIKFYGG